MMIFDYISVLTVGRCIHLTKPAISTGINKRNGVKKRKEIKNSNNHNNFNHNYNNNNKKVT